MQNKSAFLCGVMKTYRQREKQGSKVQDSNKGPDESKIKVNSILMLVISVNRMCSPSQVLFIYLFVCVQALLERTGYTLDVTTGQRKYGGPPPDDVFKGTQPGIGTEVREIFLTLQMSFVLHKLFHEQIHLSL